MIRRHADLDSRSGLHGGPPSRPAATRALRRADHSQPTVGAPDLCRSYEADAATLTRLFDAVDNLQNAVRLVARRDNSGMQAGPPSGPSPLCDSLHATRSTVSIPQPDEEVPWDAHLRADVPRYVLEQLRAEAYRTGRTAVSVVLQAMSAFHDDDGNAVFRIRERDMVADRRKGAFAGHRKPLQSNPAR